MPISSFRLNGTIGRNYKTDFDDTLRAKEALRDLEYYEEPSYGMTGYPDEALFNAIEEFQKDYGLQRDGIMKPGGETETALTGQLAAANSNDALHDRSADDQLAQMQLEVPAPGGAVGGAIIGGAIGYELLRQQQKNRDPQNRGITDPFPILPPRNEPTPKLDNKTEFPASGPEVPSKLITPIPSAEDPNILIYPTPDEGLANFGNIVEERRETPATKAQIDRIRDWFYETHDPNDWDQYGGRDRLTGKEKPEYYIPGPAGDFAREDGRPADGRQGSRRPDLTFINEKTGQRIHFQTADVDKNYQVTSRERDAEHDIQRFEFLRGRNPDRPYSTQIVIIPKNAPLKNFEPVR